MANETNLDSLTTAKTKIKGFQLANFSARGAHHSWKNRKGGGTAIFARDHIQYTKLKPKTTLEKEKGPIEMTAIQIHLKNSNARKLAKDTPERNYQETAKGGNKKRNNSPINF